MIIDNVMKLELSEFSKY